MSRIRMLPTREFDPALQALLRPEALDAPPVELGALPAWAQNVPIATAFLRFKQELEKASSLPPRLIELVRLRIAFHNQCRSCMAFRSEASDVDDALVCELATPEESEVLTNREQIAVRYADLVASSPLDIDDDLFASLLEQFTELEVIELGAHIAVFVGFGRIAMSWDLVDHLPEHFQRRDTAITPWDGSAHVVGWR